MRPTNRSPESDHRLSGRADAHSAPDRSAGLASALAVTYVAGQIAALRLIDVAPYAVFQHYLKWSELRNAPIAFAVLIIQTVICLVVASRHRLPLLETGRHLGFLRLAIVCGVIGFALVVPAESATRAAGELLLAAWIALVAVLNIVLTVRAIPERVLDSARNWIAARLTLGAEADEPRRWDRRLPWIAAGWVAVCCAVLSWFVFDGVPHNDDSVSYLFQAKMLARGQLQGPAPPDAESFGVNHMIFNGPNWYTKFFPGWPALLAVGVIARVPWLVNPLLGAAAIVLTHALVLRLFGRATANATVILLAVSPWLLATSSEMMSHAATVFWALLALLAIDYQRGRRVGVWAIVAGVSLGALYLTRPFDAALLGTAAALWGWGVGGKRLSLGSLAAIAIVSLGIAGTLYFYNTALTGIADVPPFKQWNDGLFGPGVDRFGFGPNVGVPLWRNMDPLPGHGLADVVLNANKNFFLMSFELFGWATGSLILALLACVLGPWRRADTIMFGVPLIVIIGTAFYWAPGGPDLGARYWYLMIVPVVVLTVRGAQMLAHRLKNSGTPNRAGARIAAGMFLASATAFLCVMPWRSVTKYHRYREIGNDVRVLARQHNWDHVLVFVRSTERADYQAAFNFNDPRFGSEGPVYALDAGPEHRAAVVQRFADRPIWIIGRRSDGREGLVVTAGPLPAGVNPPGDPYPYERSLYYVVRP